MLPINEMPTLELFQKADLMKTEPAFKEFSHLLASARNFETLYYLATSCISASSTDYFEVGLAHIDMCGKELSELCYAISDIKLRGRGRDIQFSCPTLHLTRTPRTDILVTIVNTYDEAIFDLNLRIVRGCVSKYRENKIKRELNRSLRNLWKKLQELVEEALSKAFLSPQDKLEMDQYLDIIVIAQLVPIDNDI